MPCATWPTANTKTRSKYSSTQPTRLPWTAVPSPPPSASVTTTILPPPPPAPLPGARRAPAALVCIGHDDDSAASPDPPPTRAAGELITNHSNNGRLRHELIPATSVGKFAASVAGLVICAASGLGAART